MTRSLAARAAGWTTPRLLVLFTDCCLTIAAFGIAWLLRFNFRPEQGVWQSLHALLLLNCRLPVFLYLRSSMGIIRHTGVDDVQLLGKAVTASSLFALLLSLMFRNTSLQPFLAIPTSILFIEYFVSLVLLIGSRFLLKYVYRLLTSSRTDEQQPVLIYGAGELGVYTKQALLQDRTRQYQVLGFIDDDTRKLQKIVQGLPVFAPGEALRKFVWPETLTSVQVVIAISRLSAERRQTITNLFLPHNVTVKLVPPVEHWINGRLRSAQIRDIRIEDLLGRSAIQLNNQAILEQVGGQVVLVTGAAGSIGSELVRQVCQYAPARLILLDQAESALHDLLFDLRATGAALPELVIQVADVVDVVRVRGLMERYRPALVLHAAAYKHVPLMENQPYEAVKTNVFGTKVLADLAVEYGVGRFVLVSTDKAVNPTNVMGATKRLAEMYVQSLNQPDGYARRDDARRDDARPVRRCGDDARPHRTLFMVTRFGNVLGSNGSVVQIFRKQIEAGGPVTITHPDIFRYFMTIPEASQLVLEAAAMGQGGDVFVFDMGEPVRIADLARQMIRLSGLELGRDIKLAFTGLRPGEKLYEELLNANELTLPTHHPKIMIAKVVAPDAGTMQQTLDALHEQLTDGNELDLVALIKTVIPEYISQNSVFAKLDAAG